MAQCHQTYDCSLVIFKSIGLCNLYRDTASLYRVNSSSGVYVKARSILTTATTTTTNTTTTTTTTTTTSTSTSTTTSSFETGLVHYWPIDNDFIDIVGGATMSPGAGNTFINGKSGMAVSLVNGYLTIPAGSYFNPSAFTVMVWIYPSELSDDYTFIDFYNDPTGSDNIIISYSNKSNSGKSSFLMYDAGNQYLLSSVDSFVGLNDWNHLAIVWDGHIVQLYLNGKEAANSTQFIAPSNILRNHCLIGRSSSYPSAPDASATFDEIKIYDIALDSSYILNYYNDLYNSS